MTEDTIRLRKINETHMHIDTETGILYEMDSEFQFEIPNAKWNPKVQAKVWDGIIRQVDIYKRRTHVGLLQQIVKFAKDRDYDIVLEGDDWFSSDITPEQVHKFVLSLNLEKTKKAIKFATHQYIALFQCLKHRRHLIQSPTGSGKSAQIYSLIRFLTSRDKKALLLVPNVGLVSQMVSDFEEYSEANDFDAREECHLIYDGATKTSDKSIVISTWQSLQARYKVPKDFFEQFDAIIVDEVHMAKSTEISGIVEKCINAKYKLGFTGSLDKSKTHKQQLIALFGETTKVASTSELQDKGMLSDIRINALVLKYPLEVCRSIRTVVNNKKKLEYKNEAKFIAECEPRNRFIAKLACAIDGNTLILVNHVDTHGIPLYEEIVKRNSSDTFLVHGGIKSTEREEIRLKIQKLETSVTVATYGTMSTGTNIPNIHNLILAYPTKSYIRVIQSIGRGLRVADGKSYLTLFDLADDLKVKSKNNHTLNHFAERLKFYSEEGFTYSIKEIPIEFN